MQTAASSRGVSRSARATDGLLLESTYGIGFSALLDEVKSYDPMRSMKSVGNGIWLVDPWTWFLG